MYVGHSSLQTSAAAPLPPPCLAVLVDQLSEISRGGGGRDGEGDGDGTTYYPPL
jgi:hypothetical protein